MEEKKAKTVEMKSTAQGNTQQKLTYEQLNEACSQLFQQNQQLLKQVRELNVYNSFKRLDYLFKVLDSYNGASKAEAVTFTPAFAKACVDEIENAMTLKEEPKEESKE